jgi:tyrosine-protein kinase Etk/Wzc
MLNDAPNFAPRHATAAQPYAGAAESSAAAAELHGLEPNAVEPEEQGIDLLALVAAFVTEWRLALITFVLVALLGFAYVFHLKSQFVATATILPEGSRAETTSLSSLFSAGNSGTLFTGLLGSRSVANGVIDQLNLRSYYHTKSYADARAALAGQSSFSVSGDSILTIAVRDADAQEAARIAEAYLDGLDKLNLTMAQDQSHQMQRFFLQQLDQEKADLNKAEDQLEATQKQTGLVQPETQTQIGLGAIAGVRAQIVGLQVQLASLLQSETEQAPQVQRLRSELAQLKVQESTLENGRNTPMGAAPSAGQMPQTGLDFVRAQREVAYHTGLVNSLASQYETARLSEDLSRPAFQIIDRAVVPERKSWPPRRNFLLVALGLALLTGFFVVAVKLLVRRILSDPTHVQSLRVIRDAFGRR